MDTKVIVILLTIYMIVIGIEYYIIFNKHHKRNKITLDELIPLVTRFYTTTIISTLAVAAGVYFIFYANEYKENRMEVITCISLGIAIISATILNYIFYIQGALVDPDTDARATTRKAVARIGEILELIVFIIFTLMPLWSIPHFLELVPERKELIKEIIKSFAISFAAMFLLFTLNPIDIKGKLSKNKKNK